MPAAEPANGLTGVLPNGLDGRAAANGFDDAAPKGFEPAATAAPAAKGFDDAAPGTAGCA
jgi:hypothetical protein